MKKLDNIEQLDALFKQNLDKLEVPAPPEVWANVASSAAVQSSGMVSQFTSYFSSLTNIVKVALFVGGTATVGLMLYKANTPKPVPTVEQNNETEVLSNNSPNSQSNSETTQQEETTSYTEAESTELNEPTVAAETHNQAITDANALNELDPEADLPLFERSNGRGTDVNSNFTEQERTSNTTSFTIICSSKTACTGDICTFKSSDNIKGDWYMNGVLVKSNDFSYNHRFEKEGKFYVEMRRKQGSAGYSLAVYGSNCTILCNSLGNGQYQLSLSGNEAKVQQWLLNGSLLSTNQIVNARLNTGKVHIAAQVTEGNCIYLLEEVLDIKGIGSFSSPDIFTPNGDNLNDEYMVNISNYLSFNLRIYDVNNKLVFETGDPKQGWNGKLYNLGEDCAQGIYIVRIGYTLEGEAPKNEFIKLTLER